VLAKSGVQRKKHIVRRAFVENARSAGDEAATDAVKPGVAFSRDV
jgi:hypothetical protein